MIEEFEHLDKQYNNILLNVYNNGDIIEEQRNLTRLNILYILKYGLLHQMNVIKRETELIDKKLYDITEVDLEKLAKEYRKLNYENTTTINSQRLELRLQDARFTMKQSLNKNKYTELFETQNSSGTKANEQLLQELNDLIKGDQEDTSVPANDTVSLKTFSQKRKNKKEHGRKIRKKTRS